MTTWCGPFWLAMLAFGLGSFFAAGATAQEAEEAKTPAQFFVINEPITEAQISQLESAVNSYLDRAADKQQKPVLVFEFRADDAQAGASDIYSCARLSEFFSTKVSAAKQTIAYVPHGLKGYALLPALACDEIVLGEEAALGPIAPENQPRNPIAREIVETLAKRKGRDAGLLLGMLDPQLDLREVQTANNGTRFVPAAELDAFRRDHQVLAEKAAWEGGQRGVLQPQRARELLIASRLAANRAKLATEFNLEARSVDPTLGGTLKAKLIQIDGPLDAVQQQYAERQIAQAVQDRVNLIVFRLNSEGGLFEPAGSLANRIERLSTEGVQTIAFVDDRALGMTSLAALACDEIIVKRGPGPRLGDLTKEVPARGAVEEVRPGKLKPLADRAASLARNKLHPEAIARAFADASIEVVQARDNQSGGVVYLATAEVEADPQRYTPQRTIKAVGDTLTVDARLAVDLGLARSEVGSLDEWLKSRGLEGIRVDQPSWVDSLVATLNSPVMSGLLLFIGLFMLILELKLPGVGLPAIISALAFLLFFWSHYLGGTADRLEILLFLAGLVALALELFVFPGFGIFGGAGVLLVLGSVIMASHTFIWPTQAYEFRQLAGTLGQITITIVGVTAGAVVLGRYFPSMPLFKRMILAPPTPESDTEKPIATFESTESLAHLLGERGRTTTVCRPIGRARFGDTLVDVIAEGNFLDPDTPVEVVEVRGTQILVKRT